LRLHLPLRPRASSRLHLHLHLQLRLHLHLLPRLDAPAFFRRPSVSCK
jgi:hypothetical protein